MVCSLKYGLLEVWKIWEELSSGRQVQYKDYQTWLRDVYYEERIQALAVENTRKYITTAKTQRAVSMSTLRIREKCSAYF